jgi:hypothetical protein
VNDYLQQIQQHAKAVKTRQLQELQDSRELLALPGVRVTIIRKPWPVGETGLVLGVWRRGTGYQAQVDLDGRVLSVPLDALTRRPGGPNCQQAYVASVAAWIKHQGSEFLE